VRRCGHRDGHLRHRCSRRKRPTSSWLDDHFATHRRAIEEGRAGIRQCPASSLPNILTSNVPEMVPYLAFVLFRIPLPLTIIQILAVDLGTDMLPALALGAERPDPDIMRRPPRPRSERLLDWGTLLRAYLFLGSLEAIAGMAAFLLRAAWRGLAIWKWCWQPHANLYLQATTACLSAIIAMQVVNVFLCRHPSMFRVRPRPPPQSPDLVRDRFELLAAGVDRLHAVGQRAVRHRAAGNRSLGCSSSRSGSACCCWRSCARRWYAGGRVVNVACAARTIPESCRAHSARYTGKRGCSTASCTDMLRQLRQWIVSSKRQR